MSEGHSISNIFKAALGLSVISSFSPVHAAVYPPRFFMLNLHVGYESVNPTELNARVSNTAKLGGVIGGKIRAERGLIYPDWSHWLEVGYFFNSASTRDLISSVDSDISQNLSYLSVIPFGISFWFFKTAFVDLGASFGLGGALLMNYSSSIVRVSNGAITAAGQFSSPFAPTVDSRIQGRLWFGKYWGLDGALGMRFLSAQLKDASGSSSVTANLVSFSVVVGATYAFGGYKGVGRTYAEVLKSSGQKPAETPAPLPTSSQPSPTPPLSSVKPATGSQTKPNPTALKAPARRGAVR